MAKLAKVIFNGISGVEYEFNVYPFDTDFTAIGAVYFVTRRKTKNTGDFSHWYIYIGQTDDLSTRFDNHHKTDCFDRYDANCICTFPEENEQRRLEIESDLLENYSPPCND